MSIYLNKDSKILVQGMTGGMGSKHTTLMVEAGSNIVGGVNAKGWRRGRPRGDRGRELHRHRSGGRLGGEGHQVHHRAEDEVLQHDLEAGARPPDDLLDRSVAEGLEHADEAG
jgi:hypothetical protein